MMDRDDRPQTDAAAAGLSARRLSLYTVACGLLALGACITAGHVIGCMGRSPDDGAPPAGPTAVFSSKPIPTHLFRKSGNETIDGRRLWQIGFREVLKPSLIKTVEGADQPARGIVWVDPSDGSVLRHYGVMKVPGFGMPKKGLSCGSVSFSRPTDRMILEPSSDRRGK